MNVFQKPVLALSLICWSPISLIYLLFIINFATRLFCAGFNLEGFPSELPMIDVFITNYSLSFILMVESRPSIFFQSIALAAASWEHVHFQPVLTILLLSLWYYIWLPAKVCPPEGHEPALLGSRDSVIPFNWVTASACSRAHTEYEFGLLHQDWLLP